MLELRSGACQSYVCRAEAEALRERAERAERQRRVAEGAVSSLELTLDEVTRRCVTLERLGSSDDHEEVLRAIRDVVVNLVGSEELAIFELSPDRAALQVRYFAGVAGARLLPIPLGQGPLAEAATAGRSWFSGDGRSPGDAELNAWVPLRAQGTLVGALAVWRLLPHKLALEATDRLVLQLLGSHAGNALVLTSRPRELARAG